MKRIQLLFIVMALCMAIPWSAAAQTGKVSGTVTDERNDPLPGVSVVIKGTTKGTATDADGRFSLEYQNTDDILVFSFVGYQSQEIRVGSQSVINIALAEDISTLQEVVVIGYGEVKKSDLTGALSTVKGDNLNRTPSVSVDQLLQGKAAGLQVIAPSGEPGAGATVRIRGLSSFNGSNSPLMVVDGFPWGDAGNLKQINTEDIESIEILKDASASAI